jgi:hypothetical protein
MSDQRRVVVGVHVDEARAADEFTAGIEIYCPVPGRG